MEINKKCEMVEFLNINGIKNTIPLHGAIG